MSDLTAALDIPLTADRRRMAPATQELIGGECERCGAQTWPRRAVCHRCGSPRVAEVTLPTTGRLLTWTRVWVPVEGLEPPYLVGLVEIGRLQLFGHVRGIDDDTATPAPVRVRIDPDARPPFWFEAVSA